MSQPFTTLNMLNACESRSHSLYIHLMSMTICSQYAIKSNSIRSSAGFKKNGQGMGSLKMLHKDSGECLILKSQEPVNPTKRLNTKTTWTYKPKGSMSGIFTYIYHKFDPNVDKYASPMDPIGNEPFPSQTTTASRPFVQMLHIFTPDLQLTTIAAVRLQNPRLKHAISREGGT